MQSKQFKESFGHNYAMSFLQRCSCEDKGKVLTFSIHQMFYNMFYSSMDYIDPDIVIIYGNTDEMSSSDVEDIHTDMSYRNMSSSRDTVLILTDVNKDRLRQGVKAVNATRPMKQLVAPHLNSFWFTTKRADIDSDTAIINAKLRSRYAFFVCMCVFVYVCVCVCVCARMCVYLFYFWFSVLCVYVYFLFVITCWSINANIFSKNNWCVQYLKEI